MRSLSGAALLLVAAGGAAGSVARHLVGLTALGAPPQFPWGTLAVNVVGSFVLGAVLGAVPPGAPARLLLGTGLCGGFTTFSAFSAEAVALAERGQAGRAAAYVAASVALGVLAAAAGAAAGRAVTR
jgi:CrcB protein